ncbi:MAG: dihydrofolate reductase family protein [Allosphingosinicella sp.]
MRKLVTAAFISLDGVMQAPGGPDEDPTGGFAHGGWVFDYWDEAVDGYMAESFATPFDLLLGRRTYEIFAAHWPSIGDDDPVAKTFNAITKFVATSSVEPLAWQGSVALHGDVPAEVARLKEENGPNLLTQGSSVLVQSLLARGLIDEFRLLIFPLLLGRGKKLFGDGTVPSALKLVDSKVSTTGVVMNSYVPDGAVHTGSFALAEPTAAEIERRTTWKQEER